MKELICQYKSSRFVVDQSHTEITIGRCETNDITIDGSNASREHATIELLGDRIIYTDHSTNGSHFKVAAVDNAMSAEGLDFVLHRGKWVVSGNGVIGIGEPVDKNNDLISFKLSS